MDERSDVTTLFLLLDVAEAGSLTAGARSAGMTASAASQRISGLERRLGQPVVTRLPRGVELTEAGAVLVDRARLFRHELRAAQGDLDALANLERGRVRLGSFPTVSASLLAEAIRGFRSRWPDVEVLVRSALRAQLVDMLQTSEVDIALMWGYSWTAPLQSSFSVLDLAEDETVLLVDAESSLRHGVDLVDLRGRRFITRAADHPASEVLTRSCAAQGFEPDVVYQAHDYREVEAMVSAGIGIAMVPLLAASHPREDVRVVRFSSRSGVPSRSITLASLARRSYTPGMFAMVKALRAAASGMRRSNEEILARS